MTSPGYGYPPPPGFVPGSPPPPGFVPGSPPPPRNGLGTAALIVAIGGLLFCWTVVGGIAAGIVAVILGIVGRGRAVRGEATNAGVAIAGAALGLLAVIVSLVFAVIWFRMWQDAGADDFLDCMVRAGNDQQAADACRQAFFSSVDGRFSVTPTP